MLEIELDMFSGVPNPTWVLTDEEERELLDRVTATPALMKSVAADQGKLGYRGMIVRLAKEDDGPWSSARLASNPSLPSSFRIGGPASGEVDAQQWLLETSEKLDTEVDDYLRAVVDGTLQQVPFQESVIGDDATGVDILPDAELSGAGMSCGSNWITGTNFSFWNTAQYVRNNNCYNFAANHRTNTFAQPGRRVGRTFRTMSYTDMANALAADGWRHSCVAQRNLSIALVVATLNGRYRDFHFYRVISLSSGTIWGHKPGSTPARYTDESNRIIRNPQTASRGIYNLFYGYWYQDNQTALVN